MSEVLDPLLQGTTTPKLGLNKPLVGGDWDAWGDETNANWDLLDKIVLPVVSDAPPSSPSNNSLWFDSVGLQLYIRYWDGSSSQWVPTNTGQASAFLPISGGTVTGPVTFSSTVKMTALPTDSAGLASGTLYLNGGFVCVVP